MRVGVEVGVIVGVLVGVGVSTGVGVYVGVAVGRGVSVLVGATVGVWPTEGVAGASGVGCGGIIIPHHFATLASNVALVFLGTLSRAFARGVFFQDPSLRFVPVKVFLVTGSHRTQSPFLGTGVKYFGTSRLSSSLCAAT